MGQAFGEAALITGGNRNASCRAVGFVDCLVLSKLDFDSVLRKSESVFNELRQQAADTAAQTARAVQSELELIAKSKSNATKSIQSPNSLADSLRDGVVKAVASVGS